MKYPKLHGPEAIRLNPSRMSRGKVYRVPGYARTLELHPVLSGYLVKEEDGTEVGRRVSRDAAIRLVKKGPKQPRDNPSEREVERCKRVLAEDEDRGRLPPLMSVNPELPHTQPDLFGGESTALGTYVPLERLSQDEIRQLPRKAFSLEEWRSAGLHNRIAIMKKEVDERGATRGDFDDEDWKELPRGYRKIVMAREISEDDLDNLDPLHLDFEYLEDLDPDYREALLVRLAQTTDVKRIDIDDAVYEEFFEGTAAEEELYADNIPSISLRKDTPGWTYDGARVRALAMFLNSEFEFAKKEESRDLASDSGYFDMWVADRYGVELLRSVETSAEGDELRSTIEHYVEEGLDVEEIEDAIGELLTDASNWEVGYEGFYSAASAPYYVELDGYVYIDSSVIWGVDEFWHNSDMEKVKYWLDSVADDYMGQSALDRLQDVLNSSRPGIAFEVDNIETDIYLAARPDWENIKGELEERFDAEAAPARELPDYQVAAELSGGWKAYELAPAHLRGESKELKHCIASPSQPHLGRLKRGDTRVFSIRKPDPNLGEKRVVTIEAVIEPSSGDITRIDQIKGKSNRLPGTVDVHGGRPMAKGKHVDEVLHIIEFLNEIGINPYDVRDFYPRDGSKKSVVLSHPKAQARMAELGLVPRENPPQRWGPVKDFGFPLSSE